jgi:hypothetical protein
MTKWSAQRGDCDAAPSRHFLAFHDLFEPHTQGLIWSRRASPMTGELVRAISRRG